MKARIASINESGIYAILNMSLIAMAGVLFFAYIYLVNTTVFHIVAWQKTQKEAATIRPALSTTESEYLSLEREITMAKAKELNFQTASNPEFIARESLGKGLSMRSNP